MSKKKLSTAAASATKTKRGPGRPPGSLNKVKVKRGPGRPAIAENAKAKRGPGRPPGSKNRTAGKRGPGRPAGSTNKSAFKRGPGRPPLSAKKGGVNLTDRDLGKLLDLQSMILDVQRSHFKKSGKFDPALTKQFSENFRMVDKIVDIISKS
jgi:hypothetical protein